mmetsp:Transcript_28216/g.91196  ORF Transcript_28216/g.91196 Transcript_28216/m.91196 type:complete len:244 (-) Transcript_28216:177-908(-)
MAEREHHRSERDGTMSESYGDMALNVRTIHWRRHSGATAQDRWDKRWRRICGADKAWKAISAPAAEGGPSLTWKTLRSYAHGVELARREFAAHAPGTALFQYFFGREFRLAKNRLRGRLQRARATSAMANQMLAPQRERRERGRGGLSRAVARAVGRRRATGGTVVDFASIRARVKQERARSRRPRAHAIDPRLTGRCVGGRVHRIGARSAHPHGPSPSYLLPARFPGQRQRAWADPPRPQHR